VANGARLSGIVVGQDEKVLSFSRLFVSEYKKQRIANPNKY